MKRSLILGMSALLAVPIISVTAAFAEDSTNTSTTNNTTTTSDSTTESSDNKELLQRVEQRKAELKLKLTSFETNKLKTKCKASQGLLSSVKGRIHGIETSRSEVYKNMVNRLTDLSTKLKNKGVDTTELNADIATLKTKIDTFNTDLATYKQDVSDLAAMDCTTDPDGFKASLTLARTDLKKVQDDAAAVRSYLNDTIKPLLKQIRQQLEADKSTTTDNSEQAQTGGSQ